MNFKMQATKITQVENFYFAHERTLSQDNSNCFLCFTKTLFKVSVFDELESRVIEKIQTNPKFKDYKNLMQNKMRLFKLKFGTTK